MADRTSVEDSVDGVLRRCLADETGEVLVVNPDRGTISALVSTLNESADPPTVHLLSPADPLKDLMADFLVASRAAELVEDGTLRLRTADLDAPGSLLLTEAAVWVVVPLGERVAGLVSEAEALVQAALDHYRDRWRRAERFALRTPPLSRVRETLAEELGPETAADFDAVLAALEAAIGDGDGLDEVTISLLVAARNGELLYDISKWGEDVGVASKATFSRTKTRLEDQGLLATEKVPIDVGRPRLRLLLGDERLETADPAGMAAVARRLLEA